MSSAGSPIMQGPLSSWLFQGAPPSTTSSQKTQGPLWLQQALEGAVNAATQLAGQPYQQFPGQTVASPSANTTAAWNLAPQVAGKYQPYLDSASSLISRSGAPINASDIQQFLNPYQDYITGALNRNLTQNLLPGIQDKFVSAGQSRSPQEAELTSRALQDTQNAVGQSLAGGYQGALSSLLQQRGQLGTLGAETGQLGALQAQMGAGDVNLLGSTGAQQDALSQANINSAMNQFQQQQQWPYQNLGFLSDIIRGLPLGAAGTQTSGTTTSTAQQPSGLQAYNTAANAYAGGGYRRGGPVAHRGALSRGGRMPQQFARAA